MHKWSWIVALLLLAGCGASETKDTKETQETNDVFVANPFLPGDFADPFIINYRDTFYVYATTGSEATVWRSADFVNWKLTVLNWPTEMRKPDIWAPAVTRGTDGRFYLYTSTDHNIYAGVSDHPMGPFKNIVGEDSIFIRNRQWWPKMHSIDADCFVDDDGQAYLYWGSGFDFKDGICAVGRLQPDMASFREDPVLVTPTGYFEGPHMMKRNGTYYLMYSDGLFYDSSYKVRYATSSSPMGPFTEGANSPILTADPKTQISGPGHHSTLRIGEADYIIYHRHAQPLYAPFWGPVRQVCIEKLEVDPTGQLGKITATNGIKVPGIKAKAPARYSPVRTSANQEVSDSFGARFAFDNSYGSIWAAPANALPAVLTADYGKELSIHSITPVFDQVMGKYDYSIEYSNDSVSWTNYFNGNNGTVKEWPVTHTNAISARYVRLTIRSAANDPKRVGLWELIVN